MAGGHSQEAAEATQQEVWSDPEEPIFCETDSEEETPEQETAGTAEAELRQQAPDSATSGKSASTQGKHGVRSLAGIRRRRQLQNTKRNAQRAMAITCTINSPTGGDYTAVRTAVPDKLTYVTFNREVGKNGIPHLQVFARANNQLKTKAWQEALGGRCIAIQRVTAREDARDYAQGFKIKTRRQERKPGSQTEDQLYEEYGTYV